MGCRRENTGRGFTSLRATPPLSEGWHKRGKPVVIDIFPIEIIAASKVCWDPASRIWAWCDTPHRVLRIWWWAITHGDSMGWL